MRRLSVGTRPPQCTSRAKAGAYMYSVIALDTYMYIHIIMLNVLEFVSCSVNISVCVFLGEEEIVIFHT